MPDSVNVGISGVLDGAGPGFMDSWDPPASVWSIERLSSVLTLDYLDIDGFSRELSGRATEVAVSEHGDAISLVRPCLSENA